MDTFNQAKNLINQSQNILILPASELQGDILASSLALFFTLKKLGKNANLLIEEIPEKFQFLINSRPSSFNDFVISVDTAGKEIAEMRYEKNDRDLKIYLALNKGGLEGKDISFTNPLPEDPVRAIDFLNGQSGKIEEPDLLITLGAKSLESLGTSFDRNPQLFYETSVLNIDNQLSNENFGEVNLIEIRSPSLSEILTNLIKLMGAEEGSLLNKDVATYLLTGIIYASQNFRNSRTRPQTFEISAFLIEKGANHQKIIQHLYKQKGVSQLKLLGRVLEKLNFDKEKELYSAVLTQMDFQENQATPRDLGFVTEELKFNFRYLPNLLILWESHASPPLVKGIFYSQKTGLIEKVLENFEGVSKGEGILFLIRDSDLNSAKEKVLQILT